MLPTVAEKDVKDIPVVVIPDPEGGVYHKKKYVIIAVSVVAVLAIVVGGFVAGMFLMHKSSNNLVEVMNFRFKDANGKAAQQTVKVDQKKKQIQLEVKKDGEEFKMINDFERGLTVYRTKENGDADCYVTPLNRTDAMDQEILLKYKNQHPNPKALDSDTNRNEQKFTPAAEPIADPSFLGKSAREMCKGLDVYWLYPTTEHDRQKRGLRVSCEMGCSVYFSCCPWRKRVRCWCRIRVSFTGRLSL